jgi:hypothetical protein
VKFRCYGEALLCSCSNVVRKCDRSAEYLSRFLDEHLRRGIKDKTDYEIEDLLG